MCSVQMQMNRDYLKQLTDEIYPWVVEQRRALHRVAELGFEEFKTQKLICKALDDMGIAYTTIRTGVVGIIEGAQPGRVVGLRADIDALPIQEPEGCEFRSEHDGVMHACGHDMHAAILLGAARMLMRLRDTLHGTVKLIFQPAEETVGGALCMVEADVLENPHVDVCYGLHIDTSTPIGTITTRYGTMNASTDAIHITVRGRSAHGAYPENGIDAIVCASQLVTALQTLVSRNISPLRSAVLSFGSISGGHTNNIICDEVRLHGTLRTAENTLRDFAKQRIHEIAQGIASAFGAEIDVNIVSGSPSVINHERETNQVLALARNLYGEENVGFLPAPSMGGEDFSEFAARVPAAFYRIGVTDPADMPAQPGHTPLFCPNERGMHQGILMQTALVLSECGIDIQ